MEARREWLNSSVKTTESAPSVNKVMTSRVAADRGHGHSFGASNKGRDMLVVEDLDRPSTATGAPGSHPSSS